MKHREGWLDVYLVLLAVGWIDGRLDPRERGLILRAATMDRLPADHLAQLEEAARWPLSFDDLVPDLGADDRPFVYAMASLVTRLDGLMDPVEEAALDALAQVLGIAGGRRMALDDLATSLGATDVSAFDPDEMRGEVARRLAAVVPGGTPGPAMQRVRAAE
jgi:hypothetical protein